MFQIKNLRYSYESKTVLAVASWVAMQGEQWLLKGKSGSGKTTLLHILAGLQQTTAESELIIAEKNIKTLKHSNLDIFRGQNIGIVFQQTHLIKTLTVLENLLLANYAANKPQDKTLLLDLLESLQIESLQKKYPHQISGGEAQRVSIARALANQPKLLLADEPTSALDDENTEIVVQLLKSQAKKYNTTLVIATHDNRLSPYFEQIYTL
jgi:putative ABC transport system ATP-binding protein